MENSPSLSDATRVARLQPPADVVRMVLDTDTYNEVDDQFALVYALRSPEWVKVEAIYAAPYSHHSTSPAEGMELSYKEILRLLELLHISPDGWVFKGASGYLKPGLQPRESPAAIDLVARAMNTPKDDPLYVVAIGAITNVASAILMEPRIIERIVVVWLGGNALHWPHTREYNLGQDVPAARLVFDCGVPLVHIPCEGVTTHLATTIPELERYLQGHSAIGDYLVDIVRNYETDHFGWSKVIWDIATIAYLIDSAWVPAPLIHSPILTDQVTWSFDRSRHLIRSAAFVYRDPIFRDLFTKLQKTA
ncbi:MAG: nucleoside hydrolase [Chloroflexota bacterium]|nr:nucleoside hydrolase [Chloroflexota bacterium]